MDWQSTVETWLDLRERILKLEAECSEQEDQKLKALAQIAALRELATKVPGGIEIESYKGENGSDSYHEFYLITDKLLIQEEPDELGVYRWDEVSREAVHAIKAICDSLHAKEDSMTEFDDTEGLLTATGTWKPDPCNQRRRQLTETRNRLVEAQRESSKLRKENARLREALAKYAKEGE